MFFSGVAFPTCISVNNCVCHFTPLTSDLDVDINDGDMLKMLVSYFTWVFMLHIYNTRLMMPRAQ